MLNSLAWVIAVSPLIVYAGVVGFAAAAALYLGHWPAYANPDPKSLPVVFGWARFALFVASSITFVALPVVVAVPAYLQPGHRIRSAVTGLVAWGLWFAASYADPGGIYDWFFD